MKTDMENPGSETLSSDKISSVYGAVDAQFGHKINDREERWKTIDGWPYEISDRGSVRRTGHKKGAKVGICRKWGRSGKAGCDYPNVNLCRDTESGIERKTFLIHRLVAEYFIGPIPESMEVDHIDGDRYNCSVNNLELKTPSENIRGSVARGHRGKNRWNSKLDESAVISIMDMNSLGIPVADIAKEIKVSKACVYHVIRGENWRHVKL